MRVKRLLKNIAFPLLCSSANQFSRRTESFSHLSNSNANALERRVFSSQSNGNDYKRSSNENQGENDPSNPGDPNDDDDFYYYAPLAYILYLNYMSVYDKRRLLRKTSYHSHYNLKNGTPILDESDTLKIESDHEESESETDPKHED